MTVRAAKKHVNKSQNVRQVKCNECKKDNNETDED